jgi:hypothetical protein
MAHDDVVDAGSIVQFQEVNVIAVLPASARSTRRGRKKTKHGTGGEARSVFGVLRSTFPLTA